MEQEADIVTAIDRTQAEHGRSTTASTESIPRQTTTSDSTSNQTETVSAETTKTDEESHTRSVERLEECKEEQVPKAVGKKQTRRRRSQLDDLTIGAPSLPQGKRTCSSVDYTTTLDREETKFLRKRYGPFREHDISNGE